MQTEKCLAQEVTQSKLWETRPEYLFLRYYNDFIIVARLGYISFSLLLDFGPKSERSFGFHQWCTFPSASIFSKY